MKLKASKSCVLFHSINSASVDEENIPVRREINLPHESPQYILVGKSSKIHWGFHGCKAKENNEKDRKTGRIQSRSGCIN